MKVCSVCVGMLAAVGLGVWAAGGEGQGSLDEFKLDPVHSTVIFRIKHLNVSYVYGRFNDVSGTFALATDGPARSAFDVTARVDSVDTNSAARDKHLRSPDFFDATRFPTIRFKSTGAKKGKGNALEVSGDVTLHGVTKPITVTIELTGRGKGMRGETRAGFECVFSVKRSDFGMAKMIGPVGDEVRLIVSGEGVLR